MATSTSKNPRECSEAPYMVHSIGPTKPAEVRTLSPKPTLEEALREYLRAASWPLTLEEYRASRQVIPSVKVTPKASPAIPGKRHRCGLRIKIDKQRAELLRLALIAVTPEERARFKDQATALQRDYRRNQRKKCAQHRRQRHAPQPQVPVTTTDRSNPVHQTAPTSTRLHWSDLLT